MTIRDIDGKVPWSAGVYYDEGRCGSISVSSASDSVEQAHADARQWLRKQGPDRDWWFLKPACVITVGYRNIIDGSRA